MEPNRDKFRKWLEGRRPRQVVATFKSAGDWCRHCPIANFLSDNGHERASVGARAYTMEIGKNADFRALPKWAVSFIQGITSYLDQNKAPCPITASRALKILDGIEQ